MDGLYRRAVAKRFEPVEMEHLKGDVRMVAVIHKAVLDRERGLGRDLVVPYGTHRLRITQGDLDRLVEQTRQKRGNHNVRRAVIARRIRQALWAQQRRIVERRLERATPVTFEHDAAELGFELDTQETAAATLNEEQNRFLDNIGAIPELREALERIWPLLTAEELLHDLFGAPSLLRLATRHVLTEDEGKLLTRQRSASVADVAWSAADLALLDEAHRILGPLPTKTKRRRTQLREAAHWMIEETVEDIALQTGELDEEMRRQLITRLTEREQSFLHEDVEDSEPTAYGHIIVDEAQDISAMQWRMITRRNPGGSMTIVGDLGQASRPGAIASWHQALAQLPARREPRLLELTVNYRTPAELMEVAARVLAVTDPMLIPPRSVRQSGAAPLFARVSDTSALALEVADQVSRLRSEVQEGRVAVIAPPAMVPAIQDALVQRGQLDTGDGSTVLALEHPVAVFTPLQAKGLEFDAVVLVEPSELAGGTLAGLRGLYVGLTRATRFLAVVYCADLPDPLATLVSGSQ